MKTAQTLKVIVFCFFVVSCGNTKFRSPGTADKAPAADQNMFPPNNNSADNFQNQPSQDMFGDSDFDSGYNSNNPNNSPNLNSDDLFSGSGDSIEKLKQECWFAVSGSFLPSSNKRHNSTFPKTHSGNPIGHGEKFDDVGGVFLAARAEPYERGKGGKEIDKAIQMTFDGIAIAPGMKVTIKDGRGNILNAGNTEGPLVAISSHYYNGHSTKYWNFLRTLANIPMWMKTLVRETPAPTNIKLQSARWVQVEAIPGSKCDFEQ